MLFWKRVEILEQRDIAEEVEHLGPCFEGCTKTLSFAEAPLPEYPDRIIFHFNTWDYNQWSQMMWESLMCAVIIINE